MMMVKRKRPDKATLVIVVLVMLAIVLTVKQFPKKAVSLIPEKMLNFSCSVARESISGAEEIDLTNTQKKALLEEMEEILIVRQGFSEGRIGPYDKYIYRVCFENKQMISEKKGYFECEIDDCGKIYTQQGSYRMIGDFSGVLTLLDGLF